MDHDALEKQLLKDILDDKDSKLQAITEQNHQIKRQYSGLNKELETALDKFRSQSSKILMDLELYDYQARLTDGKGRSTTRLQIEAETLGELFDVVEEIRCRTPQQHIAWEKRPKEGVVNPPNVREVFMAEDMF